jgi:hypothetical protein
MRPLPRDDVRVLLVAQFRNSGEKKATTKDTKDHEGSFLHDFPSWASVPLVVEDAASRVSTVSLGQNVPLRV